MYIYIGMGTSTVAAIEECSRLLLLHNVRGNKSGGGEESGEDEKKVDDVAAAVDCFCGKGMVTGRNS